MNNQNLKSFKVLFIVFLFIGIIFYFSFFCFLFSQSKMRKICTEKIDAVVTNIDSIKAKSYSELNQKYSENTTVFAPVYIFKYNNKSYTLRETFYSNTFKYHVGDNVSLFINPNNPEQFISENYTKTYSLLKIIFLSLGSAFTLADFIVLKKIFKEKNKLQTESLFY